MVDCIKWKDENKIIHSGKTIININDTNITKVIMKTASEIAVIYFSGIAYVMNPAGETVDTMKS